MDDRRNKVIVGAVVVVVVIGLVVLVVLKSSMVASCELEQAEPKYNFTEKPPAFIKSSDNKALAQFAGHLRYIKKEGDKDAEKVYLALSPQSIKQTSPDDKSPASSVTLSADCATLEYKLFRDDKKQLGVASIHVELVLANGEIKSCDIANPAMSLVVPDTHYKCATVKEYSCDATTKDKDNKDVVTNVAKLSVNYLEYEVDGDPEKIKDNKYSTKEGNTC